MDVVMPKLSDTMEEGTLLQWFVHDGDAVAKGDVICEIETDKATMAFEAPAAGVISALLPAGETVDVGAHIATIGAEAASVDMTPGTAKAEELDPEAAGADDAATGIPTAADGTPDWIGEVVPAAQAIPPSAPPPAPVRAPGAPVAASPLARTRARELGVDVTTIVGSGPGGRIVRADVEAAAGVEPGTAAAPPVAAEPPARAGSTPPDSHPAPRAGESVPLGRLEAVAARRLAEAQLVPQYDVQRDIDARRLHELRLELAAALPEVRPTVGDVVVLAVARAAARHPELLGQYTDGARRAIAAVDVGVAVATDAGLLVPVIRGADALAIADVSAAVKQLAGAARAGQLRPDQMDGAAISVSNLGMFGVDRFRAILNPPEAAIVAVGRIREEAIVQDGQLVAGRRMSVTLTADHRVLDGARAAQLLDAICAGLEHPTQLLLP